LKLTFVEIAVVGPLIGDAGDGDRVLLGLEIGDGAHLRSWLVRIRDAAGFEMLQSSGRATPKRRRRFQEDSPAADDQSCHVRCVNEVVTTLIHGASPPHAANGSGETALEKIGGR
jgi:hypothetical protein